MNKSARNSALIGRGSNDWILERGREIAREEVEYRRERERVQVVRVRIAAALNCKVVHELLNVCSLRFCRADSTIVGIAILD